MLGPEHLVTDVGSTKGQITAAADRLFNTPDRAGFLPGIPWRAKSAAAQSSAMPTSFAAQCGSSPIFLLARSAQAAALVADWREWVVAMGARTIDLEPRATTNSSRGSAIFRSSPPRSSALLEDEVGEAPELKDVGGRALREMTRLGASPFSMWRDIAHTNTEAIEAAFRRSNSASPTSAKTCAPRNCATSSNGPTGSGASNQRPRESTGTSFTF